MLNSTEEELLKSVSRNPATAPRLLISPEINMAGQWFTSPLAIKVFSAVAQDALMDKPASLVSILSQSTYSSDEIEYLTMIWKAGKITGEEDLTPAITALRNDGIAREVNRVWSDYNQKLKHHPATIRDHVNDMGAELATISNDGAGYNPDPTAHYDDLDVVIGSSWRCNALDALYGGVPNMGYALLIAPTGYGKSSFSRSIVAYSVIRSVLGEDTRALIATNEMKAGVTSRGIRDALRDMWREERSNDDIDDDIRRNVKLYEDVYSYSRFEQMIYWHRPRIAVIDSLDALGFPAWTEKYRDEKEKHQARAIALNDLSGKYGCFIVVPANSSGENQIALKQGKLDKIYQASAFGSAWYEGKSTYATVMTWDVVNPGVSIFKNTKNRPMGQRGVGTVVSMSHSDSGHYYRDSTTIHLN